GVGEAWRDRESAEDHREVQEDRRRRRGGEPVAGVQNRLTERRQADEEDVWEDPAVQGDGQIELPGDRAKLPGEEIHEEGGEEDSRGRQDRQEQGEGRERLSDEPAGPLLVLLCRALA